MWSRRKVLATASAFLGSNFIANLSTSVFAQTSVDDEGSWLSKFKTYDGRVVEYFATESPGALPLVCHHGTPHTALGFSHWKDAAAAAGMRLVAYSRPGYGVSSRLMGRDVAQAARDTASLLDFLGVDEFVTTGWSGGGPHALACGALLAERCKGVATIAGVGPSGQVDLDFLAGMAPENVAEFGAAQRGAEAIATYLAENYADFHEVTGEEVVESLGGLVSEPDKVALTAAFAESVAEAFRWSLHSGFGGWIDDDLAFTKPWGFDLNDVVPPVTVWQGQQDNMVPGSHGQWLAEHIPDAKFRNDPDQGHISLVTTHLEAILQDLAEIAS